MFPADLDDAGPPSFAKLLAGELDLVDLEVEQVIASVVTVWEWHGEHPAGGGVGEA